MHLRRAGKEGVHPDSLEREEQHHHTILLISLDADDSAVGFDIASSGTVHRNSPTGTPACWSSVSTCMRDNILVVPVVAPVASAHLQINAVDWSVDVLDWAAAFVLVANAPAIRIR